MLIQDTLLFVDKAHCILYDGKKADMHDRRMGPCGRR